MLKRSRRVATRGGEVDVVFDGLGAGEALLVLGHGAGAGLESEFMVAVAGGLASKGLAVCRFNFPYIQQGRRSPDRQDVLEACFRSVVEVAREHSGDGPLVCGGKSLGGRIASNVVAHGGPADGLVFLGYPLHPPGRSGRLRAAHLKDIDVPMLFVEGTRDPFCPLPTLERVLRELDKPARLAVVHDGDHSFKVRRSSGRSTAEAWDEAIAAVVEWTREVIIGGG